MRFRDLHRQYMAMKAEMDEALLASVASADFIMGGSVEELERRLADYVGVRHCVSCANGTDALRLALMAWGVCPGDAVFVPDFTFFATAEAVALLGATPVFVDVREDDFCICPDDLSLKIERVVREGGLRPSAVIAVDLFGLPARYDALKAVCSRYGLHLLEDGAQGFGGEMSGRRACSFGDIATTSFFPAKPLGCYGDGGALFTDSDEWAALLRSLRQHGRGSDKYENVHVGLNSRLDTLQAAVLLVKMRHFDDELAAVRIVAERYGGLLQGRAGLPVETDGRRSAWAQYTIRVEKRDDVRARLTEAGIPTAVYYPRTMSRQSAFAHLGQSPCPVADRLTRQVLSLPMHPYLADNELEMIASKI